MKNVIAWDWNNFITSSVKDTKDTIILSYYIKEENTTYRLIAEKIHDVPDSSSIINIEARLNPGLNRLMADLVKLGHEQYTARSNRNILFVKNKDTYNKYFIDKKNGKIELMEEDIKKQDVNTKELILFDMRKIKSYKMGIKNLSPDSVSNVYAYCAMPSISIDNGKETYKIQLSDSYKSRGNKYLDGFALPVNKYIVPVVDILRDVYECDEDELEEIEEKQPIIKEYKKLNLVIKNIMPMLIIRTSEELYYAIIPTGVVNYVNEVCKTNMEVPYANSFYPHMQKIKNIKNGEYISEYSICLGGAEKLVKRFVNDVASGVKKDKKEIGKAIFYVESAMRNVNTYSTFDFDLWKRIWLNILRKNNIEIKKEV